MTDGVPLPPVLLVDDDAYKRVALRAALAPIGCPIMEADSGRAALRCVTQRDFAVILIDVRMPELDGFETAGLIRQRERSELTPIIFLTAHSSDELDESRRFSAGAVDFMFAPLRAVELRAKVAVFTGLQVRAETLATEAREIQTAADELRLLTEAAPIGIFRTDAQDRYVYTNPHWSEITGVTADAATGQLRDAVLGTELVDPPAGRGRRFALEGDGGTRVLRLVASAVPGGDGGGVGTLADVTAEVAAAAALAAAHDEATEASQIKSDFIANMSHEIRTPMNGVIGMTDLLLETELAPRQREYAQTARNSGEALLAIINDLLDFSKVEAGKLGVEAIEFELRTIAEDVTTLLAYTAQVKGLELILVIDRRVPHIVVGDPGRVRQVLTNLIGNAIKFTHEGEIVVRVGACAGTEDETLIRFEVSDTGDGIAADKLEMIFQPFAQADMSTSRRYGGTGLGLSISSHLVALMGGDHGVSSELGSGSTFWFTLPAPYRDAPEAAAPDVMAGTTALVVDDNATQREVLAGYLSEWGFDVSGTVVKDALAAVRSAAAAGRPFGVIVAQQTALDRTLDHSLPLVVVTTLIDPYDGGRPTVSKPVRRGALLAAVRRLHDVAPEAAFVASVQAIATPVSGRLLVAEDNPINLKVAVAMLTQAGYEVDTAVDGAEAVAATARQHYDAILMDCQMPEINGYQATAAIREREGSERHTPIIALTASARPEDRERCLAEGMDSYMAKPLDKDALLALLTRALHPGTADAVHGPALDAERPIPGSDRPGGFVVGAIEQFVTDSEPCLIGLRRVLDERDSDAVRRCARTLKDLSSALGATRLAASCEGLERRAAGGYLTLNRTDLEEIEVDYEQLRTALDRELEAHAHTPETQRA